MALLCQHFERRSGADKLRAFEEKDDRNDNRKYEVSLTQKGIEFSELAVARVNKIAEAMYADLPCDPALVAAYFIKISENIDRLNASSSVITIRALSRLTSLLIAPIIVMDITKVPITIIFERSPFMKPRIISLILALSLMAVSLAACNSSTQQSTPEEPAASGAANTESGLNLLDEYAKNPIMFNTLATGAFSADPADAPTDEELAKMLDFAMSSFTGHGLTPWQFVVVRDVDAQKEIFGDGSTTGSAVVTPGTVAVLV